MLLSARRNDKIDISIVRTIWESFIFKQDAMLAKFRGTDNREMATGKMWVWMSQRAHEKVMCAIPSRTQYPHYARGFSEKSRFWQRATRIVARIVAPYVPSLVAYVERACMRIYSEACRKSVQQVASTGCSTVSCSSEGTHSADDSKDNFDPRRMRWD